MSTSPLASATPNLQQRTFLGHPLGLYVLFFSEMWERFSFYGMRALLTLYMVNYFKWSQSEASSVYKWYTSLVYLTPLLGGYLADRYLGNKRAVIIGAILMALGQFLLTFEHQNIFVTALGFMIIGNGFFKPNMSTQVGRLYPQNDARRDGAYTIFYMGINLGAFLSPIVCGFLADHTLGGHHTGFMAAGIGMLLGLVIYLLGQRWVIELPSTVEHTPVSANSSESSQKITDAPPIIGAPISEAKAAQTPSCVPWINRIAPSILFGIGFLLVVSVVLFGGLRGVIAMMEKRQTSVPATLQELSLAKHIANGTLISLGIVGVCALIAGWILTKSQGALRDRVLTVYVLGFFVVFFWAAFEQAGNVLNIWADKATDRYLTRAAPLPPIYPEKLPQSTQETSQQGQEANTDQQGGMWRWINMWRFKPSKPEDSEKKGGLWSSFVSFFNPLTTAAFQSINALGIILVAPLFAWMWTALDRRGLNPSVPAKMAIGLCLMALAFVPMLIASQREDQPSSVSYTSSLPVQIKLNDKKQLCSEEKGELKPYQFGRLTYDETGHTLHMKGVLADTERDHIVRDTAPPTFVRAIEELQKKTEAEESDHFAVAVTLDPVPPGFDLRYAGTLGNKVSFDETTKRLTAKDVKLADKDVKTLLVCGGEPTFREAVNELYQNSGRFRVSPWWLVWFYLIATCAELCLSPVGLSMVSKLAPAKFATMLMGLWLLTNFFGNFAAGAFGERWGEWTPTEYFLYIMAVVGVAALVLSVLIGKTRAMMHGVR